MYPLIEWKKKGGYRKACSSQHESCTVQGRAAQRRTPALLPAVLAVDKDTCLSVKKQVLSVWCLWSKRVEQNRNTTEWTSALLLSDVRFTLHTDPFFNFPTHDRFVSYFVFGCRSVLTPTFVMTASNHILVLHIFSNCQLLDCMCVKMYLCCLLTYMSQHIMAAHKW